MKSMTASLSAGSALAAAALAFASGCTAADDYMEERKAARQEKAEKAEAENKVKDEVRAVQEIVDRRAKYAREDTVKDDVPLHASNPAAWFHETDDTMRQIRLRLVAAISKTDQLVAKYEGKATEAADKADGYPKLLAQLEAAKAADKWPVAVGRFFIDSAEKCDAKIAEVKAAAGSTSVSAGKDGALLNGVRESAKAARERLKAFDADYAEFSRIWDMFRAKRIEGVPKELNAQVKDAMAVTKRFLEEWETVE